MLSRMPFQNEPPLNERVSGLADTFAPPSLPQRGRLDRAIEVRRQRQLELDQAREALNVAFGMHGGQVGVVIEAQPVRVQQAAANMKRADAAHNDARADMMAARTAFEVAFEARTQELWKAAESTLTEVADLMTELSAALVMYYSFAFRHQLPIGRAMREILNVQDGARALRAIVNAITTPTADGAAD